MQKVLSMVVVLLLFTGCASRTTRHGEYIREGILRIGIVQDAFKEVWGAPDRAGVMTGDEYMAARINGYGGGFFKGRDTLEVWQYDKINIILVFDKDRKLASWKTDKTVEQLKPFAKPRPALPVE